MYKRQVYELTESLQAPIEKGVKAGEAVYMLDGQVIAKADVITSEAVERASLPTVAERLLKSWCR